MITLTRSIPGGVRRIEFDDSGHATSMVDDFGRGGETRFDPASEFVDAEIVAEVRKGLVAVTEPRRRRACRGTR